MGDCYLLFFRHGESSRVSSARACAGSDVRHVDAVVEFKGTSLGSRAQRVATQPGQKCHTRSSTSIVNTTREVKEVWSPPRRLRPLLALQLFGWAGPGRAGQGKQKLIGAPAKVGP